jgi:hypothetical protein
VLPVTRGGTHIRLEKVRSTTQSCYQEATMLERFGLVLLACTLAFGFMPYFYALRDMLADHGWTNTAYAQEASIPAHYDCGIKVSWRICEI